MLDISKLHMMKFHYDVIDANVEIENKLICSGTDCLIYSTRRPDIYILIKQNRERCDLSCANRPDMQI
ncbi:MAG: hypothetical protein ACKPKO_43455 [Candidatus Fonsibacter sp.]